MAGPDDMKKPPMPLVGGGGRAFCRMKAICFPSADHAGAYPFPISFVPGAKPSLREQFMTRFANATEKSTDPSTTILHALALMNGQVIADQTALERSELLAAILDAPFLDTAEQIETLYLATLARKPKPKELERAIRFIENSEGGNRETVRKHALADIFWALLNSPEFYFNH